MARRGRLRRPQTVGPAALFTLPTCIRTGSSRKLCSSTLLRVRRTSRPAPNIGQRNVEHRALPDADLRIPSQSSDELLEPAAARPDRAASPDVHGAGAVAPRASPPDATVAREARRRSRPRRRVPGSEPSRHPAYRIGRWPDIRCSVSTSRRSTRGPRRIDLRISHRSAATAPDAPSSRRPIAHPRLGP